MIAQLEIESITKYSVPEPIVTVCVSVKLIATPTDVPSAEFGPHWVVNVLVSVVKVAPPSAVAVMVNE